MTLCVCGSAIFAYIYIYIYRYVLYIDSMYESVNIYTLRELLLTIYRYDITYILQCCSTFMVSVSFHHIPSTCQHKIPLPVAFLDTESGRCRVPQRGRSDPWPKQAPANCCQMMEESLGESKLGVFVFSWPRLSRFFFAKKSHFRQP